MENKENSPLIQPFVIRMRDAPAYLGMSPRTFNEMVRPCVREVVFGVQGVAFLRDDLEQWAVDFFDMNATPKPERRDSKNFSEKQMEHRKPGFEKALADVRARRKTKR